jgi:hypothetical protein
MVVLADRVGRCTSDWAVEKSEIGWYPDAVSEHVPPTEGGVISLELSRSWSVGLPVLHAYV